MKRSHRLAIAIALVGLFCASPARAHETDQFTVPLGRKTADLGPHMAQWAYDAIERGVEDANSRIEQALKGGNEESAARSQTPEAIASIVVSGNVHLAGEDGFSGSSVSRHPIRLTGELVGL